MPFLAKEHHPVPTKDLLSWTFDDLSYDWDDPVSPPQPPPTLQRETYINHSSFDLTNHQIYIDALQPSNAVSARLAHTTIRQLAAGFRALGLQKGECVCIHSFNSIWYPIFFLGVIAAGGVYAGTNPAYTAHELAHALRTSKAKFVLSQADLTKPVLKAAGEVGLGREKVVLFNPGYQGGKADVAFEGQLMWRDLLKHGERDWERFDDYETARTTTAALLFSSGTTGLPKAAMLSHLNFVAEHTLVYEAPPRPYKAIRFVALPMFHAASAPMAHTTPLRSGEKMYVLARFDLEKWFWACEKYAVTDVTMVPPVSSRFPLSPSSSYFDSR
jgi:4-coumarate--CoA ligase